MFIEDKKTIILKTILKYLIAFIIGGFLCFIALYTRHVNEITDKKELYRVLSDAFVIPGVLLLMSGVLVSLSNEGALTFLGYAFRSLKRALIPFSKTQKQTYYEYVSSREKLRGYSFLYIVGLIFFVVGLIFVLLFYKVS